jgi:hypothetical protein
MANGLSAPWLDIRSNRNGAQPALCLAVGVCVRSRGMAAPSLALRVNLPAESLFLSSFIQCPHDGRRQALDPFGFV